MAEPLLIPADAAQRLLAAANGDAALLYLYLFENRPLSGAQTALRMTQARYDLACATLQQLGLWPQEARTHLDASQAPVYTEQDVAYAFDALNLYKLYLVVDNENVRAIHVYSKLGFQAEGVLIHEFFANGAYHDATRMCIFQHEYRSLYGSDSGPAAALPGDGPDPVR